MLDGTVGSDKGRGGGSQGYGESKGPGFEHGGSPERVDVSGERCNEYEKPDMNAKVFHSHFQKVSISVSQGP
ncbi:hypothetical protein PtoMrB4_45900 [Metapseudomonas otitidis]|uniref:Uncharacterized protein n=1 Tax=Metapseudomonas otitidis TaxID=319939 RepID=A0A679GIP9_9GAMM|nr:hypothetical protein PtoMrB4_45900 [Pseudomonas otitidis]